MLRESRQKEILDLLNKNGYVEINSLCRMFNVTEMTIRRDLDTLAEQQGIERTRGGAIRQENNRYSETRLETRMTLHSEEKLTIANEALKYIANGNAVYFDSGTTSFCLAQSLPSDLHILAVTNGLNICSELAYHPHVSSIMIGGEISRNTLSSRGTLSEEMLKLFRLDLAFLGTNSIELDGKVYTANVNETGLKKTAIKSAKKTYILADSSKINSSKIITYASLQDLEGLIIDDGISEADIKILRKNGVNVIIAGKADNPVLNPAE